MAKTIIYSQGRFPVQPEKGKCRGCHGDVPKGRRTWCSDKCYDTYEPSRVRHFCLQRDKGVCCFCGADTAKMKRRYRHAQQQEPPNWHGEKYRANGVFNRSKYDRALEIARKYASQWRIAAHKRMSKMKADGWLRRSGSWWEMDHIIPFSEGGLTVLENVRTLCILCHKKRTKKWRGERKEKPHG